jgi:hypothetical protein
VDTRSSCELLSQRAKVSSGCETRCSCVTLTRLQTDWLHAGEAGLPIQTVRPRLAERCIDKVRHRRSACDWDKGSQEITRRT